MNEQKKILLVENFIPDAEYIRAQLFTSRDLAFTLLHVER